MSWAALLFAVAVPSAPLAVVVKSSRGEAHIPVQLDAASVPVVAAPALFTALGATGYRGDGWADVTVGRCPCVARTSPIGPPAEALPGQMVRGGRS